MRIVVALGGNALARRGEPMTIANQRANIAAAARALAPVALEHELVISHGNGPQVGLLALQAASFDEESAYPFDVLGAQTEGMIGYLIEQELGNLLPFEKPLATLLTMTEVDPEDKAFLDPTKPGTRTLTGVEAVIDKDLSSAVLAHDLRADLFVIVIATDADAVYSDWGTPGQRAIASVSTAEFATMEFPSGSMGPKVEAAIDFTRSTGRDAVIGALQDLSEIIAARAGTMVSPHVTGITYR